VNYRKTTDEKENERTWNPPNEHHYIACDDRDSRGNKDSVDARRRNQVK
jgi:hypothetical protein